MPALLGAVATVRRPSSTTPSRDSPVTHSREHTLQELTLHVLGRVWHVPILRVLEANPTPYSRIRARLIELDLVESGGVTPGDGYISQVLRELSSLWLAEKQFTDKHLPQRQPSGSSLAPGRRRKSEQQVWALTSLGKTVLGLVAEFQDITDPDTARPNGPVTISSPEPTVEASGPHEQSGVMIWMKEPTPPIDTTIASPARRYDYLLGGKDNFKVDRDSAEQILAVLPGVKTAALENRYFLRRAVQYLAEQGVRQFLDVGTGIPTSPNVHEVAQRVDPTARIVYVDNDPIVLRHAQGRMISTPGGLTTYIDADLRQPETILNSPELREALDFGQPIALLLIAVLHFIRDDENPQRIVTTLLDALPPGSWVVVSHTTFDHQPPARLPLLDRPNTDGRFRARSKVELAEILRELDLMPPGIQSVVQWWPERSPQPQASIAEASLHAAVGRIPVSDDAQTS